MKVSRLFVCLICLFCLPTVVASVGGVEPGFQAKKGYLDFGGRFQSPGKPISLDGEWEFYWHQLLNPQDFTKSERLPSVTYLQVPGYWNGLEIDGAKIGGKGFATYRLVIDNILPYQILFLEIPKAKTAYRLYINGVLSSQCGSVGRTGETSKPGGCNQQPRFYLQEDNIELIFQMSNFHHASGGFWQGMTLSDYHESESAANKQLGLDLFIIGALLIMGFYYIEVFMLRRKERSALFFGLFSLVMALRNSFHNSIFFMTLFPGFDWVWYTKLDYLTFPGLEASFLVYLYFLYPDEVSKKIFKPLISLIFLQALFTLFSSTYQITRYLTGYQVIAITFCLYTIYVMIYAAICKRNGAIEMLVGSFIFFASIVNDMLHAQSIIDTTFLMGFGLVLFFFSQSYVITKRFTNALETSEELSADLEMMVNDQTSKIRDLLDNTGQGILSFEENLMIQQHASRATFFIFGKSIYGENVLDLMFPEKKGEVGEIMEILFKSGGKMSLVKDLLPDEFERNDKLYDLSFRWIPAGKKTSDMIMVILTDVTIKRKLEKMLEKDEQRNRKIISIAIDRHGFVRFYNQSQLGLDAVVKELNKPLTNINVVELSSHLHTMKGGLSSYSFSEVASIAHRAEGILETIIKNEENPTENQVSNLLGLIDELRSLLKQEILELGDLVPKQFLSAGNMDFFTISDEKIKRLEKYLKDQLPATPELDQFIGELRKQPLRNMIKKITSDAKHIAYQLGKQIAVQCSGEGTQVIHSHFEVLFSNLIHLVRNTVHHGIEHPFKRTQIGKPETGTLSIDITLDKGIFKMVFADDGQGIDVEILKRQAIEKGLLTSAKAETMKEAESLRLILLPGFTTRDTLSTISGRGIGMHAVASAVNELEGTLGISTQLGKGTTITIAVPVPV